VPLYDYLCEKCDERVEIFLTLAKCGEPQYCDVCDNKLKKLISATAIISDIQPYKSHVTGKMISSRSAHKAELREHGLVEVGNETEYLFKNADNVKKERARKDKAERLNTIKEVVNAKL